MFVCVRSCFPRALYRRAYFLAHPKWKASPRWLVDLWTRWGVYYFVYARIVPTYIRTIYRRVHMRKIRIECAVASIIMATKCRRTSWLGFHLGYGRNAAEYPMRHTINSPSTLVDKSIPSANVFTLIEHNADVCLCVCVCFVSGRTLVRCFVGARMCGTGNKRAHTRTRTEEHKSHLLAFEIPLRHGRKQQQLGWVTNGILWPVVSFWAIAVAL